MQHQRLVAVPTHCNLFWGRLVLSAAIAVILLLYAGLTSSGATRTNELFSRKSRKISVFLDAASNESRLGGRVNGNPWKEVAGDRHGPPGIPKVVYISVADKDNTPPQFERTISSCTRLNPEYHIEVMGDAERNQTVAQHAPSLLPVYSMLKPTERNDFWSYLVGDRLVSSHCIHWVSATFHILCIMYGMQQIQLCTLVNSDTYHSIQIHIRAEMQQYFIAAMFGCVATLRTTLLLAADALPVWWMVLGP